MIRTNLARWSVLAVAAITLLAACNDSPTEISGPQQKEIIARANSLASTAVPTGKTAVVFRDETAIPALGLALIESLGGVVTARWDNIGVGRA